MRVAAFDGDFETSTDGKCFVMICTCGACAGAGSSGNSWIDMEVLCKEAVSVGASCRDGRAWGWRRWRWGARKEGLGGGGEGRGAVGQSEREWRRGEGVVCC